MALKRVPMIEYDANSNDLQKDVKKPRRKSQARAVCISEATWSLSDQRTTLRQNHLRVVL